MKKEDAREDTPEDDKDLAEERTDFTDQALILLSELPGVIVSSGTNLDYAIDECLSRIGLLFSASRVFVMVDEKDGKYLRTIHEWVNRENGFGTFSGPLYDYEYDIPSLKPILDKHTTFFATVNDVPDDLKKVMIKLDVSAFVISSVFRDGKKIGLVGMAFREEACIFCEEYSILVNGLAGLVSLVLDRKQYHVMRSKLGTIKTCIDQLGPFIEEGPIGDEDGTAVRQRKATTLLDAERHLILETLELYNGNKLKAAKHLGLTWPSLDRRCKKLGIEVKRR